MRMLRACCVDGVFTNCSYAVGQWACREQSAGDEDCTCLEGAEIPLAERSIKGDHVQCRLALLLIQSK